MAVMVFNGFHLMIVMVVGVVGLVAGVILGYQIRKEEE